MPARKRHDPPSLPADGYQPWDQLRNTDPDRHYCYVNPNDEATGLANYLAMGYEVERKRAGGPVSAVGKQNTEGSEIAVRGQVLVSIPKAERISMNAGRVADVSVNERRLLKDGGMDRLRGQGVEVKVDVSAPYEERA